MESEPLYVRLNEVDVMGMTASFIYYMSTHLKRANFETGQRLSLWRMVALFRMKFFGASDI